jgi:hypothetical protein
MSFIIHHLEGNSRVLPVSLANTAQDPRVLHVLLENTKQRHLEQLYVLPVSLVSQDLHIRPVLVPLRRTGRVRPVVHVPLVHGEVALVQ